MPRKRKKKSSPTDSNTDGSVSATENPAKKAKVSDDQPRDDQPTTASVAADDVEMQPANNGKDEKANSSKTKSELSAAASTSASAAAPADAKINYLNTSPQLSQLFKALETLGIVLYRDFSNLTKEKIEYWCQENIKFWNANDKSKVSLIPGIQEYLLNLIANPSLLNVLKAEFARRPKVLLVLDLDQTVHFVNPDPTINDVEWIGGPNFWPNAIYQLEQKVRLQGGELELAIASSKLKFTQKVAAAIMAFEPWLRKSNPHIFWHSANKDFCLVNDHHTLRYYDLDCKPAGDIVCKNFFSNVHLTDPAKSSAIIAICNALEIPKERCVLADDTPEVREEVEAQGIATVSTECFRILVPVFDIDGNECGANIDRVREADYKDVIKLNGNLSRIKQEIFEKLIARVRLALRPQVVASASAAAVAASMAAGAAPLIASAAAADVKSSTDTPAPTAVAQPHPTPVPM